MEKKFVYVVTAQTRKHSNETFEVVDIFETLESAQQCIKECKNDIKELWKLHMNYDYDDWEENNTLLSYTLYHDDFGYYYYVNITKKKLKK